MDGWKAQEQASIDLDFSTLPACEVGQKYYALKKSSPFVNSR